MDEMPTTHTRGSEPRYTSAQCGRCTQESTCKGGRASVQCSTEEGESVGHAFQWVCVQLSIDNVVLEELLEELFVTREVAKSASQLHHYLRSLREWVHMYNFSSHVNCSENAFITARTTLLPQALLRDKHGRRPHALRPKTRPAS